MARYSESPSPSHFLCERGFRGNAYHDEPAEEDDWDRAIGRKVGRSTSRHRESARGRGGALLQPRSWSRSRSPYDGQRTPEELPREHRRRRRLLLDTHEAPVFDDRRRRGDLKPSRERLRRRDRQAGDDLLETSSGRRDRTRDKARDYQRKITEEQRMMMSGVMHPAAMQMAMMQQMSHMGMMHPSYMATMQQQQKKMMRKRDDRRRVKRPEGLSAGESSSDSSSDSSGQENGAAAMMAAMAAMYHWPHPASASAGPLPPHSLPPQHRSAQPHGLPPPPPPPPGAAPTGGSDDEIEAYLKANPVEEEAADRLRALPPHLAAAVIARGPVSDSRDPTATLLARLRAVEINRPSGEVSSALAASDTKGNAVSNGLAARRSAKSTIEKMIDDYRLSAGCAWMMRSLPPDKQKLAAKIDPAGQADPSAYVAEELRKIV